MVGWMDDEALHRTLTSGRVTFWSRSRQEYWRKGDTSGHAQLVKDVALDCDGDALLVRVDQVGVACHTGTRSCFDGRDLPRPPGTPRCLTRPPCPRPPERRRRRAPSVDAAATHRRRTCATATPGRRWRRSPRWRATAGSSRSSAGCWPTPRPPSGSTASWPRTSPARSCWSRPSTAACGRATRSSAPRCRATLTERDGEAHWIGEPPVGVPTSGNPVEALRDTVAALATDAPARAAAADRRHGRRHHLRRRPPLGEGARRHAGRARPARAGDDARHRPGRPRPRATGRCCWSPTPSTTTRPTSGSSEAWHDAVDRLDRMTADLGGVRRRARSRSSSRPAPQATSNHTPGAVPRHGRGGQGGDPRRRGLPGRGLPAVLASTARPTRSTSTGRCARQQPQPVHVPPAPARPRRHGVRRRRLQPGGPGQGDRRAGRSPTRSPAPGPAGNTPEEDVAYGEDLLADAKERAEHVMLVDLSRNDLQRVCEPGTVDVVEFMTIRRYSHIMHLESTVVGDIRRRPERVRRAARDVPRRHPLRRAEAPGDGPHRRARAAAGAACTAASSATSTSPATSTWRSRSAPPSSRTDARTSRPAAGIVADSVPQLEHEESINKAAAALRAVATAAGLRAP